MRATLRRSVDLEHKSLDERASEVVPDQIVIQAFVDQSRLKVAFPPGLRCLLFEHPDQVRVLSAQAHHCFILLEIEQYERLNRLRNLRLHELKVVPTVLVNPRPERRGLEEPIRCDDDRPDALYELRIDPVELYAPRVQVSDYAAVLLHLVENESAHVLDDRFDVCLDKFARTHDCCWASRTLGDGLEPVQRLQHTILVWQVGGRTYALGFHGTDQGARELDQAVASSLRFVGPQGSPGQTAEAVYSDDHREPARAKNTLELRR